MDPSQIIIAYIVPWLIERLKRARGLPWISQATDRLNRFVSALLAALVAVGITVQWDPSAGTLLISGLSMTAILTFLITWAAQFILQEVFYRGILKAPPAIVVMPGKMNAAGTARRRGAAVLMIILAAGLASSCALRGGARHNVVVADTAIVQSLAAFQDAELVLFRAGQVPAETHRAIHSKLGPAFRLAEKATVAIKKWPQDTPAPAELRELVPALGELTRQIVELLPDGNVKSVLGANLLMVQQAVMLLLTMGGAA